MERKEAYEQIKKLGLQEECKKEFGKNFTQCKTSELEAIINAAKIRNKAKVKYTKAILQYDLDGNLLREFYSISEASRVLDISMGSILDCLKRRTNKSREFIFRYKDNLG